MEFNTKMLWEDVILALLVTGWMGLGVGAMMMAFAAENLHWYLRFWVVFFAAAEVVLCLVALGVAVQSIWNRMSR